MSDSLIPCTATHQAPLSLGFSRQEYWSGLPFSSPGDLPNPGVEPGSPELQADSLPYEPPGKPTIYKKILVFDLLAITKAVSFMLSSKNRPFPKSEPGTFPSLG